MGKKFILSIIGLSAIILPAASVVSCTKAAWATGENGQRIMVITDAGKITDKSFNQSAWEAMTNFTKETYGIDSSKNYVEPSSSDSANLISAYKLATYKKANTLVLAGFTHASQIERTSKLIGTDKTIVLADSQAPDTCENVISLVYDSEISGFNAAFDAAIWATTKDSNGNYQGDANGDGKIGFGTFGGMSSKLSSDSYNWGFLVGVETYNQLVSAYGLDRPTIYYANVGSNADVSKINNVTSTDIRWFSGSYELGGTQSTGIVGNLIHNGADVIFPVAGPQIQDVLSYQGATYSPYVIGVDTDQVESYSGYAGRFLSSATKNLTDSIQDALNHTSALINKDGIKPTNKDFDKTDINAWYQSDSCWDGLKPIPKSNWSFNKVGGNNLLQSTTIDFQNPTTEIDELINELKDYFENKTGSDTGSYWSGQTISEMANILVNNKENNGLTKDLFDKDLLNK